jgi:hypothetical protein
MVSCRESLSISSAQIEHTEVSYREEMSVLEWVEDDVESDSCEIGSEEECEVTNDRTSVPSRLSLRSYLVDLLPEDSR